jgi:HD-like signal output (HDOD) protein
VNSEQQELTLVSETELSPSEAQIVADIYQAYTQKKLRVPSLPDVALQIRAAIERSSAGAAEIAQMVQSDPVLTGRLVQAANSAMYGGLRQVGTLLEAINRLGLNATRNLAVALAVRDLFTTKSAKVGKVAKHLYRHSAQVAALCYVIARARTDLPPEQALLAGLIHDIGAVPVLSYVDQSPDI